MADERMGADTRRAFGWTDLFRTFLIALDPFKLLVAAVGILATALGWWLLSVIFFNSWDDPKVENREGEITARRKAYIDKGMDPTVATMRATAEFDAEAARYHMVSEMAGPGGSYRTMPWFEERGRNPFVFTQETITGGGSTRFTRARDYMLGQFPVLAEPLMKFLGPIVRLFDPAANFWVRVYLFFLIFWMLLMWAFFGGIITRMAILQIAGKEGGGLRESVRFVRSRYLSYLCSPIVPIGLIFAVVIGCIFFGLFHLIPMFGDIVVDGLFWWIPLGAGFVMALLVVGLVGYPLMYTTLSAEGSDTFDALSRSYNYVYESPWHYIWYGLVATVYGVIVVFFVVFMSSLMVYLGKWGVSQTPFTQSAYRSPEYLFVYSPTSFGWRELMLKGSPAEITPDPALAGVDKDGKVVEQAPGYYYTHPDAARQYMKDYSWYNHAGAGMVSFWMTLLFMLMLGFMYSYFWTASSMIYLLMRRKVDEVEPDEIYTEEEMEEPVAPPKLSPTDAGAPAAPATIPVDAPTLRVPTTPPPPPPPPPAPAATVPLTPPVVPPSDALPSTPSSPTGDATPGSPSELKSPEPPTP
jgi:hypothetical protein